MNEFIKVDQILSSLGLTEIERFNIYKVISAILHLNNVGFENTDLGVKVNVSTNVHVIIASQMLNVSLGDLENAILYRSIEVPGSIISIIVSLNYTKVC